MNSYDIYHYHQYSDLHVEPSVASWLGEKMCVWVKHMGQHICFGAMCGIVVNSHINVIKGISTQKN